VDDRSQGGCLWRRTSRGRAAGPLAVTGSPLVKRRGRRAQQAAPLRVTAAVPLVWAGIDWMAQVGEDGRMDLGLMGARPLPAFQVRSVRGVASCAI
jgi:hypothetical protein